MSMDVLLQGVLTADPQARTSSKGNTYATALVRVPLSDSDAEIFSVIAFNSEVVEALLQRHKGDAIAICGQAQRNVYTDRNSVERKGWKIVAEGVLSLYQARKARKAAGSALAERPEPDPAPRATRAPAGRLEDLPNDLPWREETTEL